MALIKKTSPMSLWHLCMHIIAVESQWCRHACARDKRKVPCDVGAKWAHAYCSAGVIKKLITGRDPKGVAQANFVLRNALDAAALAINPKLSHARTRPFIALNDTSDHRTVLQMWNGARDLLSERPDKGVV